LQPDLGQLASLRPDLIGRMLKQGLLRSSDVIKLAKADPSGLYKSPLLDAMLTRGLQVPRKVWGNSEERPDRLMPRRECLLRAYELDRGADAGSWLAQEIMTGAVDGLLPALFRRHDLAFRFTHDLVGAESPMRGASAKRDVANRIDVLTNLIRLTGGTGPASSVPDVAPMVLGLIRHAAAAVPDGAAANALRPMAGHVGVTTEELIRQSLIGSELSAGLAGPNVLVTVGSHELGRAARAFIEGLPVGAEGEFDSAERAQRYHRYQGRRDVIRLVVTASNDIKSGADPGQALEVALFNSGVRDLGANGEVVEFNPRLHQPLAAGLLPGIPVRVVQPGRTLGEEVGGLVIAKALVDLLEVEQRDEE
jgi:hypothetical protein